MRFYTVVSFLPLASLVVAAPSSSTQMKSSDWRGVIRSFGTPQRDTFIHVGDDGVLRKFDFNGNVLNYTALAPEQIGSILSFTAPSHSDSEKAHLVSVYDGVDGRTVSEEELVKPGPGIFPQHLFEELKTAISTGRRGIPSEPHPKRQECGHAACKLGVDDCTVYEGCSSCTVLDMMSVGECV